MRHISSVICMIVSLGFASTALAIDPTQPFANPADLERYEALTSEIRCLVCQNETIADSTAALAVDLRREVRRMVEEGMTDAEIKDFLVTRYGDFVLYRPLFKSTTALLWLAPLIMLVIGGIAFLMVLRRRSVLPSEEDAPLMDDQAS
jgi:cytochrome c-type biogenesis protein CcmH